MCDEFTATRQPQQAMADLEEQAYPGLSEGMVEFPTEDGTAEAFFVYPAEGKHPGVVFWPDAIGLRDTKKQMARRLASSGYAVLAVNQYYRTRKLPLGMAFSDFADADKRAQLMPLFASLTPDAITRDAKPMSVPRCAGRGRYVARDRHAGLLHGRRPGLPHRRGRARAGQGGRQLPWRRPSSPTRPTARTGSWRSPTPPI